MKMEPNSLELDKKRIIQWILELSEPQMIEKVKYLMATHSAKEWWDEISEEEKKAIEEGLAQINSGSGIPHQKIKDSYAKWL
jgi:hypothetical protein